ncbi:MAG: glycosyltransferase family 39 protein [Ginsengibacter sp.]
MKPRFIACLFIIAVVIPAAFSTWGLTESSEARYAEISREMYISGDFVQPKLLGIHHYHKPPVVYYITSIGYSIFGVNEYGARFFLSLALLAQLLLVYLITMLLYDNRNLSVAATLIYFSYPIVQIAAKNLTTDAYLTTFIFSSIYFFLKYHQQPSAIKYLYLFYIFCGLSFLTKGPVGILPQALFAILYTRIFKIKREISVHTFAALITGIAICISWFTVVLYQNKELLSYFFKHQLADRVAGDTFKRSKPFWYYFAFMPLLGLPAFFYFAHYVRANFSLAGFRRNISSVLSISLIILLSVFTASSSKLILYVIPLFLFISILSAKHLSEVSLKTAKIFENISLGFSCFLFVSLIAASFMTLPVVFPKVAVIIFSLTGIVCMIFFKRVKFTPEYLKAPFINAISMAVLTFLFPFIMKVNDLEINSIRPMAAFIKDRSMNKKPGSIAVYDYLLPSLAFYTNEEIITLDNGNSTTQRETQFETNNNTWQNTYFKLGENKDTVALTSILAKPNSYIIAQKKNPLPDSLSFLKKNLPNKILMGKWIIYF